MNLVGRWVMIDWPEEPDFDGAEGNVLEHNGYVCVVDIDGAEIDVARSRLMPVVWERSGVWADRAIAFVLGMAAAVLLLSIPFRLYCLKIVET